MPKSNSARNRELYQHWQGGKTIEEASLLAGVPKSTVGYYYKKYKRYAKEGRPVVIPQPTEERPRTEVEQSALFKSIIMGKVMEMIDAGDPQRAYYTLGIFKLLKDLKLEFTQKELEALQRSLRSPIGPPLQKAIPQSQAALQSNESARVETSPSTRTAEGTLSLALKKGPQIVRRTPT